MPESPDPPVTRHLDSLSNLVLEDHRADAACDVIGGVTASKKGTRNILVYRPAT